VYICPFSGKADGVGILCITKILPQAPEMIVADEMFVVRKIRPASCLPLSGK